VILLDLWHGGPSYFLSFDDKYIGTGEASALGWGHYLAEFRAGGEFYGSYLHSIRGTGFLYRVNVALDDDELLDLDVGFRGNHPHVRRKITRVFKLSELRSGLNCAYETLRQELGNEGASSYLRAEGIPALRTNEGNRVGHGVTTLVFDSSRITIREVYELHRTAYERTWRPIQEIPSRKIDV
jgi:hypothetical protein